ncbi:MAG TPA: ROK family transcriptional regulator [Anaerolineales bacterium]|nr:ROK family transcriptional regulator [Anaerolineales bacterium]
MSARKATHQLTRQHNLNLVLQTIFEHETISRAEIARSTKLSRATVSELVANLLDEGLVEEVGYGSSMGGKSPILLSLAADSRYLIGLNLAQDKFIGAIVNLRGEIKKAVEAPVSGGDGQQALKLVYQILDQLIENEHKPIVGIGVGTPGLVNTLAGVVINAVNLDWQELPLAQFLRSRYNLPVSILNDSQATAIGEFVYGGSYPSDSNLVVVNVRHGIGAGILINGRLFQGDGGGAGEIGHVVVQENGTVCRCGRRGCLETVASARAVVQRVQVLGPDYPDSTLAKDSENISLETIKKAFQADDPLARHVVLEAAHYLGISIAALVGTLNIRNIVLTGDMVGFDKPWLEVVEKSMHVTALSRMAQDTRLEIGKMEFRGCILGASSFMLLDGYELLFNQPESNQGR